MGEEGSVEDMGYHVLRIFEWQDKGVVFISADWLLPSGDESMSSIQAVGMFSLTAGLDWFDWLFWLKYWLSNWLTHLIDILIDWFNCLINCLIDSRWSLILSRPFPFLPLRLLFNRGHPGRLCFDQRPSPFLPLHPLRCRPMRSWRGQSALTRLRILDLRRLIPNCRDATLVQNRTMETSGMMTGMMMMMMMMTQAPPPPRR